MKIKRWRERYEIHRFFIVSFLISLLVGFYFDAKPLLAEYYQLKDQEKILSSQLKEKEQLLREASLKQFQIEEPALIKKSLLDQLVQVAAEKGCEIYSLQTQIKNNENLSSSQSEVVNKPLLIKMHLRSDFVSFYRFVKGLMQRGLPVELNHFSLKGEHSRIKLLLQFSAFPWSFAVKAPSYSSGKMLTSSCCVRDPFLEAPLSQSEVIRNKQNYFHELDLEQLRYVGYIADAGRVGALILLPDGRSDIIYTGGALGKTWRLSAIHLRSLTLIDKQNKVVELQRGD